MSNISNLSQLILFKWLQNNLEHPYPNEDTKRKLCEESQLSLEQLNTWFINARQRYVKRRNVKAPLTKMVLLMWTSLELDEICQKYMDVVITQSSFFLAHLKTWQQLLFWITRIDEEHTNLTEFQHVCEILISTIDPVVAQNLLYQTVVVQKFDYACALLKCGVIPVPIVGENGLCLSTLEFFHTVTKESKESKGSNNSLDEFIQLCEILDFCRETNMNL